MSTTYITKKCPRCGAVYARESYVGRPSKGNRTHYGSPIKICSKCQAVFKDDDYREIAIDGIRDVDKSKISPQTLVICGLGIVLGLFLVGNGEIGGLIFVLLSLILGGSEYFGYGKRQKKMEEERILSEKRLSNPQYAVLLKHMGFYVPEKYLPDSSKSSEAVSSGE